MSEIPVRIPVSRPGWPWSRSRPGFWNHPGPGRVQGHPGPVPAGMQMVIPVGHLKGGLKILDFCPKRVGVRSSGDLGNTFTDLVTYFLYWEVSVFANFHYIFSLKKGKLIYKNWFFFKFLYYVLTFSSMTMLNSCQILGYLNMTGTSTVREIWQNFEIQSKGNHKNSGGGVEIPIQAMIKHPLIWNTWNINFIVNNKIYVKLQYHIHKNNYSWMTYNSYVIHIYDL